MSFPVLLLGGLVLGNGFTHQPHRHAVRLPLGALVLALAVSMFVMGAHFDTSVQPSHG